MKTKYQEKNLDGNFTRMLRVVLDKSWKNAPKTAAELAIYLSFHRPFNWDEQDVGYTGVSKDKLKSYVLL